MTDRQILKAIGQNVRAVRNEQNMTLECLAELVGVHWHTILHIEQGKYPTPVTTFAKVTVALEVNADRLMQGLPEPDRDRMERVKKALARKRKTRLKS